MSDIHHEAGGRVVRKGPNLGLGAGIGTSPSREPLPALIHPLSLKPRKPPSDQPKSPPPQHQDFHPHAYSLPLKSKPSNIRDRTFHDELTGRHGTPTLASAQSVASDASSSLLSQPPSRLPTFTGRSSATRDRADLRELKLYSDGGSLSSSQSTLRPSTTPDASTQQIPTSLSSKSDNPLSQLFSAHGKGGRPSSPDRNQARRRYSPDYPSSRLASSLRPDELGASSQMSFDQLSRSDDYGIAESHHSSYALNGDLSDDLSSPPRLISKRDSDHFTRVPRPTRTRSKPKQHRDKIGARALVSPPPLDRRQPVDDNQESSGASAGTSATTATTMTNLDFSALSHSTGSTAPTTITSGSTSRPPTYLDNDEMHLALLAGQAAVDCHKLPISSWDEVEVWKKELSLLSSRLDTLQAKHQREAKILTAARTLQKLNTANKRISRQTMESLEQSERRVAAAEQEVLVLRDRESALRRRLMEHWAGVMAWEVRRLERVAMGRQEKQDLLAMESRRREEALHDHVASLEAECSMSRGLDNSMDSAMSAEQVSEMLSRLEESQHGEQQMRHERDLLHQDHQTLREERDMLHNEKQMLSEQLTELQTSTSQLQRAKSVNHKKATEQYQQKIADLEGMVVELTGRERALTEELDRAPKADDHAAERDQWEQERRQMSEELAAERDQWEQERRQVAEELAAEREHWEQERRQFDAERQLHEAERQHFTSERSDWDAEKTKWTDERTALDDKLSQHALLISEFADSRKAWDDEKERHTKERSDWHAERSQLSSDRDAVQNNLSLFNVERDKWSAEREAIGAEREKDRAAWMADQQAERQAWEEQRDNWDRERAELEQALSKLELERDMANSDRELSLSRHDALSSRYDELRSRHEALQDEHTQLRSVHDGVLSDHTQLRSTHSKLQTDHVRALDDAAATSNISKTMAKKTTMALAAILGKLVPEEELGDAAVEVRQVVEGQNKELAELRDKLNDVNRGLEEDLRRVTADRDRWRIKADDMAKQHDSSTAFSREQQNEMTELVRTIRSQNEKIAELQQEVQHAQQQPSSRALSPSTLSPDQATLSQVWAMLPSPQARTEAGLTDPNVASPSSHVNFGALQHAYSSNTSEGYPGTKGFVERVRGVVDDGRVMAERMARMEQDKEKHKQNAARAAKLVEESQRSLATYQKQVKDLQRRLQLVTGSPITSPVLSPVHPIADLDTRAALTDAQAELRVLRDEAVRHAAEVSKLQESNQALSARTLKLVEEAETARSAATSGLQAELAAMQKKLAAAEADMDNERVRQQTQNMQLLEEVNSLQAEVADLRAKLRQRG